MTAEIMGAVRDYIEPGMVVLIPFLYLVGMGLKKARAVADHLIPAALGVAGIAAAALYVFCARDVTGYKDVLSAAATAMVQGVLCAGCAVYIHQMAVKQPRKGKGNGE